ncbi:hypothetical protein KEM54_004865 [Ascosphaera aggregata]|nr:hypothetical protein KEM54_004865 [Ascosphaera aggregata]
MASASEGKTTQETNRESQGSELLVLSVLDILRFIFLAILTSSGLSYLVTQESFTWGYRIKWPAMMAYFRGPLELTHAQLALYDGSDPKLPIYLAVNGTIFDVSAGQRMYAKGAAYNKLAGAEANRAFVTGCFEEDRTPDLRGVEQMYIPIEDCDDDPNKSGCEEEAKLTKAQKKVRREQELRNAKKYVSKAINGWYRFYDKSDKYSKVGRVIPEPYGEELTVDTKPVPTLCAKAEDQRPKRSEMKKFEQERLKREGHMAKVTGGRSAH